MKPLEEILDASAQKELFENFEQVRTCIDIGTITANTLTDIVKDAMQELARQCCDEQKIECSKSLVGGMVNWEYINDVKEAILNTPNVVTTKS